MQLGGSNIPLSPVQMEILGCVFIYIKKFYIMSFIIGVNEPNFLPITAVMIGGTILLLPHPGRFFFFFFFA